MRFYHAAPKETMMKIYAEGVLKKSWDGVVYMCKDPIDACKFLVIRGMRQGDKSTNRTGKRRKWGEYRAGQGNRGTAGGQGHHSAGKNEGDSHLRRFTQYQTFGSVGQ